MTKSEDAAGVHSGHRQRLKDQFLTHGMDPIHDVNVLELILFYAIPRQDTNPIAHRLLNTFGSLAAVFDATPEELMERGGLSKNAATLIKLIPAAARRQQLSRSSCHQLLDSTQKCGDYLVPFFFGATQERSDEEYREGLEGKRHLGRNGNPGANGHQSSTQRSGAQFTNG